MKAETPSQEEEIEKEPIRRTPLWYKEAKLTKIEFAPSEHGWAINIGDGTYRLANMPIMAMVDPVNAPRWGDLVRHSGSQKPEDYLEVIERYNSAEDIIAPEDYADYYKTLQNEVLSCRESLFSTPIKYEKRALETKETQLLNRMDDVWERMTSFDREKFEKHQRRE